jgi:hypothetical protein
MRVLPSGMLTPCGLVELHKHFKGFKCLHLHVQRLSQTSRVTCCSLVLLFDPEDGGSMFLRNVYQAACYHILGDSTVPIYNQLRAMP